MRSLPNLLKHLLDEKMRNEKIGISKIAAAAGVERQSLTEWYHGRSKPRTQGLVAIADYLKVDLDMLQQAIGPITAKRIVLLDDPKLEPIVNQLPAFADGPEDLILAASEMLRKLLLKHKSS